uniref:DNA-directed RNA polymerase n=1 Tax=Pyramimonas parkeae TaxID=36894 RepID=C0JX08_9CHLO|nr:alpha subunit of RNA polymerase [Pyramimonas parkeae]ACJ71125.1 alpha subunit of RNA polymerase [Pyramimonas parkeae]
MDEKSYLLKMPSLETLKGQTFFERDIEKHLVIPPEWQRETDQELLLYALFQLGPFSHGQGLTIANGLRRTLLNNIIGFGITSVKFEPKWVDISKEVFIHEYSTIPGIWESIFEIIENLKKIKIRRENSPFEPFEKQVIRITQDKPGVLRADSIKLPPFLKILNQNQPIVSMMSSNLILDIIITIEAQTGNHLCNNQFIHVSEVCLPIKWVNYVIKTDPLLGSKSPESLFFEISTDGTITPQEALSKAADICIDLYSCFSTAQKELEVKSIVKEKVTEEVKEEIITNKVTIENLGLSVRAYNCLKRANIYTVTDLLTKSKSDLLAMKNFGKKSADEVYEALQNRLGIDLPLD